MSKEESSRIVLFIHFGKEVITDFTSPFLEVFFSASLIDFVGLEDLEVYAF